MTTTQNNGHDPDRDVAATLYRRLHAVADVPGGNGHQRGPAAEGGAPPAQDIPRHPEDPPDGLIGSAREVCDPERIRELAVRLGQALFALRPEVVEAAVDRLYGRVHDVRAWAEVSQGQRGVGEQLGISAATDDAVQEILAEAEADELKAGRLAATELPEAEAAVERAHRDVVKARDELEGRTDELDRVRLERAKEKAAADAQHNANLFTRLRMSRRQAKLVLPAEVIVFTLILATPVAQVTGTSWQFGALLAMGISLTVLGASGLVGVLVAGLNLPLRVVGVAFIGLYALIMSKFVPGLVALRGFDESGAETLTAATLAACLVAAVTGYALAVWGAHHAEVDVPTRVATEARDRAESGLEAAKGELAAARATLRQVRDRIEALLDASARGPVRVKGRVRQGTEAEVRIATIRATTATAVGQERAAAEWAAEMAILAHLKMRAEGLPEDEVELVDGGDPSPSSDQQPSRHQGFVTAALAAVSVGSFGYLPAGPPAPALGIGAAALLLLLGLRAPREWRLRGKPDDAAGAETTKSEPVPIASPGSLDSPTWRRQPDHTVPKYVDGGAGFGEGQR